MLTVVPTGGMASDIYDSMAEAVSSASVVVAFMSQAYQESSNCMLELKFAKQSVKAHLQPPPTRPFLFWRKAFQQVSGCLRGRLRVFQGVEIIPVMMAGGGWRAGGWLGLLTAGALWTRLSGEADFEENVGQLHGQIQKVVGAAGLDAGGDSDEGVVSALEAKEELERLREDLVSKASLQSAAAVTVLSDPDQPAMIPAGVPKLPGRFQPTGQIQELTRLVMSTTPADIAMPRVGFWGMGGIVSEQSDSCTTSTMALFV